MAKSYYGFTSWEKSGEISTHNAPIFIEKQALFTVGNESLLIWNKKTRSVAHSLSGPDQLTAFSISSTLICSGYRNGSLQVWDKSSLSLLHALEGHSSAVTSLIFSDDGLLAYSGSFDTSIIIWDLISAKSTVRFQGHKDAITCLLINNNRLFSGSKDRLVKVWDLISESCIHTILNNMEVWDIGVLSSSLIVVGNDPYLHFWNIDSYEEKGNFTRKSTKNRTKHVAVAQDLIFVSSKNTIEVWRAKTEKEMDKLTKRRRKRLREKGKDGEADIVFEDYYQFLYSFRTQDKISSLYVRNFKEIAVSYSTNRIEVYCFDQSELTLQYSLEDKGHRSSAKALSLSSNNSILASSSNESIKIWDSESLSTVNTILCDHATCSVFLPGDRLLLVGNKSGYLFLYDILSTLQLYEVSAHENTISGLSVDPHKSILLSGSLDQEIKVWKINKKSHKLRLTNTLTMKDGILDIKFSPCFSYIAAGLLDRTVQVLFADTYKTFLGLYGHKLPVSCFDISSDSLILASGSPDKNLRIWGMDHGDCHRSIFAHDQGITDIKFVKDTHLLFSASRDRLIKYWDADRFQCILTLKGHLSEISSIAVSSTGDFLVSTGNDFSIRMWTQTDTPLFLSEEKELEIERTAKPADLGILQPLGETAEVIVNSEDAISAAERIIKAVEVVTEFRKSQAVPVQFAGLSQFDYLIKIISEVSSNALDTALHILPFANASLLIKYLGESLLSTREIELVASCTLVLIRLHQDRLKYTCWTNPSWVGHLQEISRALKDKTRGFKDLIGTNKAGCAHILQATNQ